MRALTPIIILLAFNLSTPLVCVAQGESKAPEQDAIATLETRARQAPPRERCFLYAKLIQQMTDLSIRQYAAGDVNKATHLLKQVQQFAQEIHISIGENDKRLKSAELLLNRTAFRLKEMLQFSNFEDRDLVEQTLAQVNRAQSATMMQVFEK